MDSKKYKFCQGSSNIRDKNWTKVGKNKDKVWKQNKTMDIRLIFLDSFDFSTQSKDEMWIKNGFLTESNIKNQLTSA